jgi:hypothetical protein
LCQPSGPVEPWGLRRLWRRFRAAQLRFRTLFPFRKDPALSFKKPLRPIDIDDFRLRLLLPWFLGILEP